MDAQKTLVLSFILFYLTMIIKYNFKIISIDSTNWRWITWLWTTSIEIICYIRWKNSCIITIIVINFNIIVINKLESLDAILSLGSIATERNFIRPEIVEDSVIIIKNGRHPLQVIKNH